MRVRFRPTATRKVSPDGSRLVIYVRGKLYELTQADLDQHFPLGGYALEVKMLPGASENKALLGASENKAVPASPTPPGGVRRARWGSRKRGA